MKVSVIVVGFEVRELLAECVATLDGADEVWVVDNGRDGSAAMVRERFPWAQVLEQPHNPGFGVSVNLAASRAGGDALLLLNPDARLGPGQIDLMRARAADGAAAMGFRQIDEHGRFQLAYGGRPAVGPELLRMVAQKAIDRRLHWASAVVDRAVVEPTEVPWVAASSLLVRREAFEDVGGFDERFFLYFEDIDFCLRLWERGHRVVYDPTLTVLHRRGRSAAQAASTSARAYRVSQRRFWRKHRGPLFASLVDLYQRLRSAW